MSGLTYVQIARHYKISRQAVHEFCVKNNLTQYKQWKEPEVSLHQKRKQSFPLGPELYSLAKEKYNRKKQNTARTNKYEFTIEFEDIEWPTHCPILGIKLDYETTQAARAEDSVSFDRIDPNKGYVKGNVQILSWRANRIKNDGTAEEHEKIAFHMRKLSEHH